MSDLSGRITWPARLKHVGTCIAWLSELHQKPCRFESALYCFSEGFGLAFPKAQKENFSSHHIDIASSAYDIMKNDRELRQLWDIACQYWTSAKDLLKRNPGCLKYTCARIARFYEREIPKKSDQRNANLLLAHISSAAVRLCTIDERFCEDHRYRIKRNYSGLLQKKRSKNRLILELRKGINTWIHQMLRDNVAHIERSKKSNKSLLWFARQDAIESLTVAQIVTAMDEVLKDFKRELVDRHII